MKRFIDIFLALTAGVILLAPLLLVALFIKATAPGKVFFWSERMGQHGQPFLMPKFRSMISAAPLKATEELKNPERYVTKLGGFLRKTSIDELPQLYCVVKGDMSLVGPRPVLTSQIEFIQRRALVGVDALRPGITGWAQINGRDELDLDSKLKLDIEYLERQSFRFDVYIMVRTIFYVVFSRGISH